MKRQIIIVTVLVIAIGFITVSYFRNLNPPGLRTSQIIRTIPGNAVLIIEYTHEKSLYNIFQDNQMPAAVMGPQLLTELDTMRKTLIRRTALNQYFSGQNVFISLHTPKNADSLGYLLTITPKNGFKPEMFEEVAAEKNSGMVVTPLTMGDKKGYTVYFKSIKKRFYIINKGKNIFSGSFSKSLAKLSAEYAGNAVHGFTLLPAQQSSNSLANLYINYIQSQNLFNHFFHYNTDILSDFRKLPATAVLSLNYKSDALMFNGLTTMLPGAKPTYLNLFVDQKPVPNRLKNIFPSTTAYFTNFSLSDIKAFTSALSKWHQSTPVRKEEKQLVNTIKSETGINIIPAFREALAGEFAVVTTRYQEKFGIIAIKNGARLTPLLLGISSEMSENRGRFNYDKLPYFLLGDTFGIFKRPYFIILDNYLILANSYQEIESYYELYINRKFLIKMGYYSRFDNLLSQRSNVTFYVDFDNATPGFKRDLNKSIFYTFENNKPGWQNLSGAAYQLTSAAEGYYTNFSIGLKTDETE